MNRTRLILLLLVAGTSVINSACTKTNVGIVPAPTIGLIEKQGYDTRPLYFVDSVGVDDFKQAKVGPDDIKSINVLNASATTHLLSLYGPRAKNGAIFVTTRKGK